MSLSEECRYQLLPFRVRQVGHEMFAFSSELDGNTILLDRRTFNAVLRLAEPQLIPVHRARISGQLGHDTSLKDAVDELVGSGFLASESDIKRRLIGWPKANVPPVTTLAISTKNRPESVSRALTSCVGNLAQSGRAISVKVCDYSSESLLQTTRSVCESLANQRQFRISHADLRSVREYSKVLSIEAGVSTHLTDFAFGISASAQAHKTTEGLTTYGAIRNVVLLDTTDELLVMADDDTEWLTGDVVDDSNTLTITSRPCPFEWHPPSSAQLEHCFVDVIGRHEALLGRSVATLIEQFGSYSINDPSTTMLKMLTEESKSVSRTFLGTQGDTGLRSMRALLLWSSNRFTSIFRSEQLYNEACQSRLCARWAAEPTISDSAFCMTISMGLDNRFQLPPFVPFQRGEDGIFGMMVNRIRAGLAGFVPGTIMHSPLEQRAIDAEADWDACIKWRSTEYLLHLITSLAPQNRYLPLHMPTAGAELLRISQCSPNKFGTILQDLRRDIVAQALQRVEAQLDSTDTPRYLSRDLFRFRVLLRESLVYKEQIWLSDRPGTGRDNFAIFQELVRSFGLLLLYWESLRYAATHLKAKGTTPFCKAIVGS